VGRHSSDERGPYIRSIVTWAVPWVVVAVVVGVAVWVAVDAVGGDNVALRRPPGESSPQPRPSHSPTASPVATPTPAERPTPAAPSPSPKHHTKKHDRNHDGLITAGVTVQVINGTGGITGAAASTADQLAQLGYQVVAVTTGLTAERSVVYWSSEGARDAGLALAEHLGWIAEPAPSNLSSDVDLSVVISAADAGG
jgi:LytR cell envelope-related transcriptional attenuator